MTRVAITAASGQLGSETVKATLEVVGRDSAGRDHQSWQEYFDGLRPDAVAPLE